MYIKCVTDITANNKKRNKMHIKMSSILHSVKDVINIEYETQNTLYLWKIICGTNHNYPFKFKVQWEIISNYYKEKN